MQRTAKQTKMPEMKTANFRTLQFIMRFSILQHQRGGNDI